MRQERSLTSFRKLNIRSGQAEVCPYFSRAVKNFAITA